MGGTPQIYLVGGAVRDRLLGLPVRERDWVVVGADRAWMLAQGFQPLDPLFPVFRHPQSGEEYALARRERKSGEGYRGFEVDAGPEVSLEEDLARRDLTINAIAEDRQGGVVDPYGGAKDLSAGWIRHITPAFAEDPLRLLRAARFAAHLGHLGFRIAPATLEQMVAVVRSGELQAVTAELRWRELSKALATRQPWRYLDALQACGALAPLLPELATALAECREEGADPVAVLKRATLLSDKPEVRFAALLVAALPDEALVPWCTRNRVGKGYRVMVERLAAALEGYRNAAQGEKQGLYALLKGASAERGGEALEDLLRGASARYPEHASEANRVLKRAARNWQQITPEPLLAQGLSGARLGRELERLRRAAIVTALDPDPTERT